ncbi:uncharacterized protein LOC117322946 [Pecten maximus]|uniref:uncharacterized protein LOC117322946 n=1 Tax=Pecten maximus TaxID=6579 RepID=UPI001458F879|nr:uncharacterized protein LOC117322946 [Pecten maximus]
MTSVFETTSSQGHILNGEQFSFSSARGPSPKNRFQDKGYYLNIPKFVREKDDAESVNLIEHPDKSLSKVSCGDFFYKNSFMTQNSEKNSDSAANGLDMVKSDPVITETSQLLRGILQHKDKHLTDKMGDNNNVKSDKLSDDQNLNEQTPLVKSMEEEYREEMDRRSLNSADLSGEESDFSMSGDRKSNGGEDSYDMDNCDENDIFVTENSNAAKRARVENILSNMRQSPTPSDNNSANNLEVRRQKRKQYQPKWLEHSEGKHRKLEKMALQHQLLQLQEQLQHVQKRYMDLYTEEHTPVEEGDMNGSDERYVNHDNRKDNCTKPFTKSNYLTSSPPNLHKTATDNDKKDSMVAGVDEPREGAKPTENGPLQQVDIHNFSNMLKTQLVDVVSTTVDTVLDKYMKEGSTKTVEKPKEKEQKKKQASSSSSVSFGSGAVKTVKEKTEIKAYERPLFGMRSSPVREPFHDHIGNIARVLENNTSSAFETPRGLTPDLLRGPSHHPLPFPLPPFSYFPPTMLHTPAIYSSTPLGVEPEQTEALPLVVNQTPKKKRTKVTDTRLSPRAARALLGQDPMVLSHVGDSDNHHQHPASSAYQALIPPVLPTSVAIPNPGLQHSNIFDFYGREYGFSDMRSSNHSPLHADHPSPSTIHSCSPSDSFQMKSEGLDSNSDCFDNNHVHMTSTLTPMHLRKAKLMFFYVRYPSSAILKIYFPDVKFNKNNTAQLVKWFSNFREFFYIQMEKYARQSMGEGCKHPDDLNVTTDSELYRVLNLHYNRNNQIEVPESFRLVVQATLREFYKSIVANKDNEPSWKKSIYKVIARLDDTLPEYFKSPNWMDQLGDM